MLGVTNPDFVSNKSKPESNAAIIASNVFSFCSFTRACIDSAMSVEQFLADENFDLMTLPTLMRKVYSQAIKLYDY